MRDANLHIDFFQKGKLSLSDIHDLHKRFSSSKFAIFASFVPLFRKPEYLGQAKGFKFDDFIFGFVLYEMVSKQILSLSIDPYSQIPFRDTGKIDRVSVSVYGRSLLNLFTIIPPNFHCCCPLPIASEDYTPIPWLMYALLEKKFDEIIKEAHGEKELSISEFFTFGGAPDLDEGVSSFFYDKDRQAAYIYLIFRENERRLAYQLRFDYHNLADLHVDYETHMIGRNKQVRKLLKHQEINLSEVCRTDPFLMMSFLFTGMYDPYFDKIVDQHVAGLKDVIETYPLLRDFLDYRKSINEEIKALRGHKLAIEALLNIENVNEESPTVKFLEARGLLVKEEGRWYRTFRGNYILNWLKRERLV